MSLDNSLVVIQSKNKKYLTVLTSGEEFIINDGKISYDDVKTLPVKVESSTGDILYPPNHYINAGTSKQSLEHLFYEGTQNRYRKLQFPHGLDISSASAIR